MHYGAIFFRNAVCNGIGNVSKEFTMCDNDLIAFEDEHFNHFIHHFSEVDEKCLDFNEEFDCIDTLADCIEEILWK